MRVGHYRPTLRRPSVIENEIMSERFGNVVEWLQRLKRERPECQGEAEMAIQMIMGKRPNVEEKYDALILKLDRTYSRMLDKRLQFDTLAKESPLHGTRKFAQAKVAAINLLINDLQFMRARNRDLIQAVKPSAAPSSVPSAP